MTASAAPPETALNRALAFGTGLLLPVLTLQVGYVGTPRDLASRAAPVDVLCVLFLGVFFLRHRMARVPWPAGLYFGAILFSLVPALAIHRGAAWEAWVTFAAQLMAFGFYLLGLNLGRSPVLLRWLLAGAFAAVMGETIVVYHDVLSPRQWFPDPMPGRARGTFKANGQLGAYGFCVAGLLIVFGSTFAAPRHRTALVLAGLTASTFVFAASRRTGMFCILLWGVLFLLLGLRFARRGFYRLFAAGFLVLLLSVVLLWGTISDSFAARRLEAAVRNLQSREGFIQNQWRNSWRTAPEWFPLGFGPGRGRLIDPQDGHEIHNGLLAVLVELGAHGFVGFAGMMLLPFGGPRRSGLFHVLLVTFLLTSFVFSFHNTLYRDRTYLLFLGLATTVAGREEPSDGNGARPRS